MNEIIEIIILGGIGGIVGGIATHILIYKIIHPYITVPYLKKKHQSKHEV